MPLIDLRSTKDIAREAVEQEFERQKKRNRGGDSSSDEEDRGSRNKGRTKITKHSQQQGKTTNDSVENELTQEYRDRAKERREGVFANNENAGTEGTITLADKTVGGDGQQTHPVKGLDLALARKIKAEMGKLIDQNLDLDSAINRAKRKKMEARKTQKEADEAVFVQTVAEARKRLQMLSEQDIKSPLGRGILSFLKQGFLVDDKSRPEIGLTPSGLAIQQSSFTLSASGNPADIRLAWETPQEQISIKSPPQGDPWFQDPSILVRIQQVLTSSRKLSNVPAPHYAQSIPEAQKQPVEKDSDEDDEDDEDIFADAGSYIPESAVASIPAPTNVGVKSIFQGLGLPDQEHEGDSIDGQQYDIISKLAKKTRTQENQPVGTFAKQLQGDYGDEDMDADFAGQAEDDEEEVGSGKKKAEETTMAAKEYGRRRKAIKEFDD
jgi:IK cytokine